MPVPSPSQLSPRRSLVGRAHQVILVALVLGALALFAWLFHTVDPLCWHGYIAGDGECAWE